MGQRCLGTECTLIVLLHWEGQQNMKEYFDLNIKKGQKTGGYDGQLYISKPQPVIECDVQSVVTLPSVRNVKLVPSLLSQFDLYKQTQSSYIIYICINIKTRWRERA